MRTFKNTIQLIVLLFIANFSFAQLGIKATNTPPHPSAMLDVESTTKGLLIPRMTTAQRTGITSPAAGLHIYDTDTKSDWYWDGTAWKTSEKLGIPIFLTATSQSLQVPENTRFLCITSNLPDVTLTLPANTIEGQKLLVRDISNVPITYYSFGGNTFKVQQEFVYTRTGNILKWVPLSRELPIGTIVLSETFPNDELQNMGFFYDGKIDYQPKSFISLQSGNDQWYNITPITNQLFGPMISAGDQVFLYNQSNGISASGSFYNPTYDSWTHMPPLPETFIRENPVLVWTGSKLIIWGGNNKIPFPPYNITYLNSGYIYNPATGLFDTIFTNNSPEGRGKDCAYGFNQTTNEFVVWGGIGNTGFTPALSNGGKYSLTNNSWTTINNAGAPSGTFSMANGVYEGKLYVCSGINSGYTNTNNFYAYNIATNTWQTLSPLPFHNQRNPKLGFSADYISFYDRGEIGAKYDYFTNVWTNLNTLGAPNNGLAYSYNSTLFGDDLYVIGKTVDGIYVSKKYNLQTDVWTNFRSNSFSYYPYFEAVDNCLVFFGGSLGLTEGTTQFNGGYRYFPINQQIFGTQVSLKSYYLYKKF